SLVRRQQAARELGDTEIDLGAHYQLDRFAGDPRGDRRIDLVDLVEHRRQRPNAVIRPIPHFRARMLQSALSGASSIGPAHTAFNTRQVLLPPKPKELETA